MVIMDKKGNLPSCPLHHPPLSLRVLDHKNHEGWQLLLNFIHAAPTTVWRFNVGLAPGGLLSDWVLAALDWKQFGGAIARFTQLETLSFTNCRFQFLAEEEAAIRRQLQHLQLRPSISLDYLHGGDRPDNGD